MVALVVAAAGLACKASDDDGGTSVLTAALSLHDPTLPPPPQQPVQPSAGHYNEAMRALNVWELNVPSAVIDEARCIFQRCELRRAFHELHESKECHRQYTAASGERYFLLRAGKRELKAKTSTFRSDISWISVDDEKTHATFERLFRATGIETFFRPLVDHAFKLVVYSAFYVVRACCEAPNFHVDYSRSVGVNAITMMTPLEDYAEQDSFNLLYKASPNPDRSPNPNPNPNPNPSPSPNPNPCSMSKGMRRAAKARRDQEVKAKRVAERAIWISREEIHPGTRGKAAVDSVGEVKGGVEGQADITRYRYKCGKAICFGSSFVHSTEPGESRQEGGRAPHVYLCFTFGSDKPEHWPAIAAAVDGKQSRMLMRADGSFAMSTWAAREHKFVGASPRLPDRANQRRDQASR